MASNVTIQFKRATKEVLDSLDYVPLQGEPIYETDTNRVKIGDGIKTISALPYSDATEIVDDLTVINDENISQYAGKAASARALKEGLDNIDISVIDGGVLTVPEDPESNGD